MTNLFQTVDDLFAERVQASFARQGIMSVLGASLGSIAPGVVDIEVPFSEKVSQQHGYFHGGVVSTLCDSAAGYAGYTLFAPTDSVLTVEFKINFMATADGDRLRATGRVIKTGRTLTVCEMSAVVFKSGKEVTCAHGLATMMRVQPRTGIATG
jgi:uncharacterized protein (TIGR00369 family)